MKITNLCKAVIALVGLAEAKIDRPHTNMFTLEDDHMIIKTPQVLEDLKPLGAVPLTDIEQPMFKMDAIRPIKEVNFFREEDFDLSKNDTELPVEREKPVEIQPVQEAIKQEEDNQDDGWDGYINTVKGIRTMFDTMNEQIPKPQEPKREEEQGTFENDYIVTKEKDAKISNTLRPKGELDTFWKYRAVDVSDNRRPIYGVLTEPLRGDMKSRNDTSEVFEIAEDLSYIPKAHVQFLEQSGIVVVPISYLDADEDIVNMLDEVNGIYVPGDSHKAVANRKYQLAFSTILKYVNDKNSDSEEQKSDYFPMFLMGKGLQTFISQVALSNSVLHQMGSFSNENTKLNLLNTNHNDTFLLHQLQFDQSANHAFDLGSFYNRQQVGLRIKDIKGDERLIKWITPLASFNGSANATRKNSSKPYIQDEEFVAIAEGLHLPIYIFTYNIEMTQFVYTDLIVNLNQTEHIDKSIPARHHAQFVSHQIADEARLNNHKFELSDKDYMNLIRHHELASVEYSDDQVLQDQATPTKKGLEKHDIFIIKQAQIEMPVEEQVESENQILMHLQK